MHDVIKAHQVQILMYSSLDNEKGSKQVKLAHLTEGMLGRKIPFSNCNQKVLEQGGLVLFSQML